MTAGCLAVTGNGEHRAAAGVQLPFVVRCPYPVGPYPVTNGLEFLRSWFSDSSSGVELPAAIARFAGSLGSTPARFAVTNWRLWPRRPRLGYGRAMVSLRKLPHAQK